MDESYRNFGGKRNSLGQAKEDDEFLTDHIEEDEYDALNDETFGIGADVSDWEEDHDKFAESVIKARDGSFSTSLLDGSIFEGDDSQHEIISKSISQLGLEDDLDDPAIMTVGRSRNAKPIETSFRLSPPPPAIIDTELCGSPNAHSIWSTNHFSTPGKDSGIGSLLKNLSQSNSYQQSPVPLSPVSSDVFLTPMHAKAWTVDEIERNFLVSTNSDARKDMWSPDFNSRLFQSMKGLLDSCPNARDKEHLNDIRICSGVRTLDDVEKDIMGKQSSPVVEQIVKAVQPEGTNETTFSNENCDGQASESYPAINTKSSAVPAVSLLFQNACQFHSQPAPVRCNMNDKGLQNRLPGSFMGMSPPFVNPHSRFNVPFHGPPQKMPKCLEERFDCPYYYPRPRPTFYPTSVLDPQTMKFPLFPRRTIRHPLLHKEFLWQQLDPYIFHRISAYGSRKRVSDGEDEYSNLMTQREKEWLTRINLMLTNPENPYVEDYYHSTLLLRKCTQEALKNNKNKSGPKLLLPEKSKVETKAYVPAQFEGSLGKLQAVSVNYPRKVLDITVSRPLEDDEGRIVTNQSLMKYRRLLVDIENLYNCLLEFEDEEKRVLALPDDAQGPHKKKIAFLIDKLYTNLGCENIAVDDNFQNMMSVRKGRNLGMRAFEIFSQDQKLSFLVALFKCLPFVLRKDQNDGVLLRYSPVIISFIKKLNLSELVQLGESLENLPRTDVIVPSPVREKSNFISAFKNKVASSFVCHLLDCAESIYASNEFVDSEIQARWAKVVLHIVDILCTLPDTSIVPPSEAHTQLLAHFQRFAVDRDKFEVLKKKVKLFELNL